MYNFNKLRNFEYIHIRIKIIPFTNSIIRKLLKLYNQQFYLQIPLPEDY